jgi:hypothetical protein
MTTNKIKACVNKDSYCAIHLHSLEKTTLPQFSATKLETEREILQAFYIHLTEYMTSHAQDGNF